MGSPRYLILSEDVQQLVDQTGQPVETNQTPPIKRLDGEVTSLGDVPFAGGTYCEVWVGQWRKKEDWEEVSLSLIASILLTWLLTGCLESSQNGQIAREGA